jgi:hypothetical protein
MAVNANALATLDEVKNYQGITGTKPEDDNLIEDMINRYTTMFESYCDRKFKLETYSEYYDGTGTQDLFTDAYPITHVTTIYDDVGWEWDSNSLIASAGYRIADDNRITLKSGWFPAYNQSIKITYSAGYEDIPDDLKQVCIVEVARAFKNRKQMDTQMKTLPDGTVQYTSSDLLPQTKRVLDGYRRMVGI